MFLLNSASTQIHICSNIYRLANNPFSFELQVSFCTFRLRLNTQSVPMAKGKIVRSSQFKPHKQFFFLPAGCTLDQQYFRFWKRNKRRLQKMPNLQLPKQIPCYSALRKKGREEVGENASTPDRGVGWVGGGWWEGEGRGAAHSKKTQTPTLFSLSAGARYCRKKWNQSLSWSEWLGKHDAKNWGSQRDCLCNGISALTQYTDTAYVKNSTELEKIGRSCASPTALMTPESG